MALLRRQGRRWRMPPCSIEKSVWVNHAGDIVTPDDIDPLLERNNWMLVIRDWWFTDEPFGHAE